VDALTACGRAWALLRRTLQSDPGSFANNFTERSGDSPMIGYIEEQSIEPLVGDRLPSGGDEALLEAVRQMRAGVEVEENYRILDAWLSPRLLSYFRAHYFSHEDAEDLVQMTKIRVYKNIDQLEQAESFFAWLFRIARNVRCTAAAQQLRERQFLDGDLEQAKELPDPNPAGWSLDQQFEQKERLKKLCAAIENLPPRQRQCLLLRLRDEMSNEEIAETLQLSVNTVRNHLAEARKNLRRSLKKESEGQNDYEL
jgi:RNA polymerase sigma-70 factor (ECF subfamily)